MSRPSGLFQILAIAVAAAGLPCHGAGGNGTVEGIVTDAQGNPVSGATVQIGHPGPSRSTKNALYCVVGTPPARAPRFVQNIPLGGNDLCGDAPAAAASQREAQFAAWNFREVRDMRAAKTDGQGRYSIKAPEGNYEVVAFRIVPASGPLFAVTLGPRTHGTVDMAAGQTVTRDLTLLHSPPAAAVNGPQPPDAADWPVVFEGPVRARGSVCLNMASVTADALVAIGVSFQPALPPSQISSEMLGVRRSGSPYADPVPDMLWVKKGRDLDKSRTFKIAFGKPVTDAKVQVIGYTPGAGFGPAGVALCK